MNPATITFKTAQGGTLQMVTVYEGGYDSENPAHLTVAMLCQRMDELAEPQGEPARPTPGQRDALGEPVSRTQEQFDAFQAGADLPPHAAPQLVIARA